MEDPNDLEEDPGEALESLIEHADRPFASESFGTTAEEQRQGESLEQKLAEERPDRIERDTELSIEDEDAPDDEPEMIGTASIERDLFAAPEEAAMTVRDEAPGAVDHIEDEYVKHYDESMETD